MASRQSEFPSYPKSKIKNPKSIYHSPMEERTFEDALARLEEIVREMEGGEVSLDASLALFEEGVALSRHCASKLNEAEQRIAVLVKTEEGVVEDEAASGSYETSEILGSAMRDLDD